MVEFLAPVEEYISPVPLAHTAPAPVVDFIAPSARTQFFSLTSGASSFFACGMGCFGARTRTRKKPVFQNGVFHRARQSVFFACGMGVFALRRIGFFRVRSRNRFFSARNGVTHCARAPGHRNAKPIVLNVVFPCTVFGLFHCETERLTSRTRGDPLRVPRCTQWDFLHGFRRMVLFLCAVEVLIVLALGGHLSAVYAISVCS